MPAAIHRFLNVSVFISLFLSSFSSLAQTAPTYGSLVVDRFGATNYNLPINAPAGVGGVNPNISVTYNNQFKNGLLGKGGDIKGLSFISRCQQTLARDGISKAISWGADDRFCIDGQRLMLTSGVQGAAGSQYHTEIDNGVVYTAKGGMATDPDYFEALAKDGSILTFGGSSSAKNVGGATKTWALSRFQSREKNTIDYVYEGGADSTGLRIKRINYAFPLPDTTTGANAYIEFEYKDREDLLSQYVSGYEFRTTKTLNKINSYGAAGVLYRSYIFDVVASTALAGNISRWQGVQECISLTSCFSGVNFSWGRTTQNTSNVTETKGITVDFLGTMARNFSPTKAPQLSAKNCAWCVSKAVDLNGNGIAEFIWTDETETGTYRIATSFDGAVLPHESIKKAQPVSNSSYDSSTVQSIPSPEFGDMDADGFVDVLTPLRPTVTSTYSTYSWWLGTVARSEPYWRVAGAGSLNTMELIKVSDLDSDGFQELVTFNSKSLDLKVFKIKKKQVASSFQYYLDNAPNSAVSYHLSDYPARLPINFMEQIAPSSATVADFDGDGNEDLLLYMLEADLGTKQQTLKIKWYSKVGDQLLYRGTIAQWTQNSLSLASSAPDTNGDIIVDFMGLSKFTPIDINGDGLVDVAFKQFSSKTWMYAINTGNGFLPLETLVLPSRASNADSDTFVDVNNDGYADFIYSGTVSGSSTLNVFVKYWDAKLKKFSDPVSVRQTTRNPVLYADMNGDGYADFVEFSSADNSINVYGFTNNAGSAAGGYQGVIAQDAITSIKEGSTTTTDIEYQTLIKPGKVKEQTCKISSGNATVPCQDLKSTSQYTPLQIKITHPAADTLEGDSMDSAEYYAKTNDPFAAYSNPLVGPARVFQYVAPLPIVTRVTTTATNITSDKKYFYSVMRAQAGGRGLLGFEKTWVEDQLTGLKTETQWRQDWPFTGMESVKLLWNKYGVAISEDENTLVVPASDFSGVLSPTIRKTVHKQYSTSLTDTKQGALVSATEIGGYFSSSSSSLSSSSSSSLADVSALQLMLPEEGNITKVGFGVAQGLSAALTTSDGQVLKDINGTVPRVKYYVDNYVLVAEGNADGTIVTWTPDVPGTYSVQAKVVLPNGKELSSRVAGLIVAGQLGYPSITFTNLIRNGNTYPTNATVNLYANAVDTDGTVASVTFYANNTVIATKTAPTVVGGTQYRYDWVPTVTGTYKIKAVAKDSSNNTTSTKTIEIFVGVVPSSSSSSVSSQAYPALTMPVPSSEQKTVFGDMTSLSTQIIGSDLKQWMEVDQSIPDAKFFANNQYLGKSKASGLGLNWTPSMGGVYDVVAASLLQNGNQVVSPRGTIIVKNDSAPSVNLSAPKYEGTSYRLNDLVLVSATAESAVAATAISKLTFYANDVEIYTDTSAPYSLAWSPPVAGTYNIKAVAVDAAGNVGVSAIRRIQYGISSMSGSSSSANYFTSSSVSSSSSSVATNATIELSYPRVNKYENFGLGAEVILVSYVWASGNIEWHDANGQLAQVDYYANGQLLTGLRADDRGHLKYWTPPATGVYAIKAVAHVDNNKTIESGIGNFFIRSANAPIITVNTPAKNTTIKIGDSLQLDATVTDPDNDLAMVRFYVNDQELLLNPLVKPPFTTSWTPPTIGNYSIKVEAMDDSGIKALSNPTTISVVLPGISPSVAIVAPSDGSSLPFGNPIQISALATDLDGSISKVEFFVNEQLISSSASFPYSASFMPSSAGIYRVRVVAYDNLGNTGVAINMVQYGLAAPSVSLVDPDEDCFIGVNLNAPDNVASDLQYELYERADGQTWSQTPTVIKSGSAGDLLPYIVFSKNHAVGKYDYRARVCPVGNSAACSTFSSVVSTTIDATCNSTVLPTVDLISPPTSVKMGQPVTLTATVGVTNAMFNAVRFYYGNKEIGVDYSAPYTLNWTPTSIGRANLYAKVDAGNDGTGVSAFYPLDVFVQNSSSSTSSGGASSSANASSSVGSSSAASTSSNGNSVSSSVSSVSSQSSNTSVVASNPALSPLFKTSETNYLPPDETIPTSAPVGAVAGQFRVNESGAATYSVAIAAPDGVAGVTPKIAIGYSSQSGNGLLGKGWGLSGLSAITRCRQTLSQDGKAMPISWGSDDRFCLDGQRLMLESGTYGRAESTYKTEIDTFVKVTAKGGTPGNPDYFVVEAKDGSVSEYGEVGSGTTDTSEISNGTAVLTWNLKSFKDNVGNPIYYAYKGGMADHRIDEIKYAYGVGKTESSYNAKIKFEYESRPDGSKNYVSGFLFTNSLRLKSIKTYNGTSAPVRIYTLGYEKADDGIGGYSRVASVQECSKDTSTANCFPATIFTWNAPSAPATFQKTMGSVLLNSGKVTVTNQTFIDINGNGILDYVWSDYNGDIKVALDSAINSGDAERLFYISPKKIPKFEVIDYNADGHQDLLFFDPDYGEWRLFLAAVNENKEWRLVAANVDLAFKKKKDIKVGDVNSDGLADVIVLGADTADSGNYITIYKLVKGNELATSKTFYHFDAGTVVRLDAMGHGGDAYLATDVFSLADFNGDGQVDILVKFSINPCVGGGDCNYLYSLETMLADGAGGYYSASQLVTEDNDKTRVSTPDLNGDGLQDLVYFSAKKWYYALNTGVGFTDAKEMFGSDDKLSKEKNISFVDINHDGYTDVIWRGSEYVLAPSGDYSEYPENEVGPIYVDVTNLYVKYWKPGGGIFSDTKILLSDVDKNYEYSFIDVNGDTWVDKVATAKYGKTTNTRMEIAGFSLPSDYVSVSSSTAAGVIKPDQIETITDGLGNKTKIGYAPIGRSEHYVPLVDGKIVGYMAQDCQLSPITRPEPPYSDPIMVCKDVTKYKADDYYTLLNDPFAAYKGTNVEGPIVENDLVNAPVLEVTGPVMVVTSVESAVPVASETVAGDISVIQNRVDYYYRNLRMQAAGRGLLGFEYLTTVDAQTGVSTQTRYRQDWPYVGSPQETTVTTGDGKLLKKSTNVWARRSLLNNKVKQPVLSKSVEKSYSLYLSKGSAPLQTITTETKMDDDYGNVDTLTITTEGSDGKKLVKLTDNKYPSDLEARRLGRLERSTATSILDANDDTKLERKVRFEYYPLSTGSNGLLWKEVVLDEAGTDYLTTEYIYDDWGNKTQVKVTGEAEPGRSETRTTTYAYDTNGRYLVSTTNDLSQAAEIKQRDAATGQPSEVTDINKITANVFYDGMGNEYLRKDATGAWSRTDTLLCDANASCPATAYFYKQVSVAGGGSSTTYYDSLGRAVRSTKVGFKGIKIHVDTEYDGLGRVKRQSLPYFEGETTEGWTVNTYDILGQVLKVTAPDGSDTISTPAGLSVTIKNDLKQERTETRNGLGQLLEVSDHLSGTVKYTYNANGDLLTATTDSTNRADGVTAPVVVKMCYDYLGRKKGMLDPDKGGWLATDTSCDAVKSGAAMGWWKYSYNAFGELISQRDAKNQTTTMKYDQLGRMIERVDEEKTLWFYDKMPSGDQPRFASYDDPIWLSTAKTEGKLLAVIVRKGVGTSTECQATDHCTISTYDAFARPVSTLLALPNETSVYATSVKYDGIGRVYETRDVFNGGVFTNSGTQTHFNDYGYAYRTIDMAPINGGDGLLTEIKETNARGQVLEEWRNNSNFVVKNDYYAKTGLLKTQKATTAVANVLGMTTTNIQDESYGWDTVGNLKYRSSNNANVGSTSNTLRSESFCYDGLNRLTTIVKGQASLNPVCGSTQDVEYDGLGNITSKKNVGSYHYGSSAGPHAVTSVTDGGASTSYAYDSNGNMRQETLGANKVVNRTFTYTTYDLVKTITKDGATTSFNYGADRGRWQRMDVKGGITTTTTYLGNIERVQKSNSSEVEWRRAVGGAIITIKTNANNQLLTNSSNIAFVFNDHLGSVDAITDANGKVTHSLSFDPWGARRDAQSWDNLTNAEKATLISNLSIGSGNVFTQPITNRGFTGHEMVDDMDIIHMNGRIYDAKLGRFLQADSFIDGAANTQGYNRYSYVHNNPLNVTDPSGFSAGSRFLKKIKPFAGVIVAAVLCVAAECVGADGALAWGYAAGAISGAAQAAANGGNILRGAITGMISAGAFGAIGAHFRGLSEVNGGTINFGGNMLTAGEVASQVFAHAMTGGVLAVIQGGDFGSGFLAAGITKGFTNVQLAAGNDFAGAMVAALIGGTVSELTGGKFANGASTAAFQFLFNAAASELAIRDRKLIANYRGLIKGQIDENKNAEIMLRAGKFSVTVDSEGNWKSDLPGIDVSGSFADGMKELGFDMPGMTVTLSNFSANGFDSVLTFPDKVFFGLIPSPMPRTIQLSGNPFEQLTEAVLKMEGNGLLHGAFESIKDRRSRELQILDN